MTIIIEKLSFYFLIKKKEPHNNFGRKRVKGCLARGWILESLKFYFLRKEFFLDENILFVNHGSYGAVPKPVFQVQQGYWRSNII